MNRQLLQQIAEGVPFGVCFEEEGGAGGGEGGGGEGSQEGGEGAQGGEGGEGEGATGWAFAEGIAGEGDVPEWFKSDKYANVSEQAKAYKDLEGKFGAFTGAPEAYEVKVSEELTEKGVVLDAEDPMVAEAMKFAKEANMDQAGFERMMNLYSMVQLADQEANALRVGDELKALGQNGQGRVDALNKWGSAHMSEELFAGFQEMVQSASAVKALEHLVGMTNSAPLNADGAAAPGGITESELNAMQFEKDTNGNRRMHTDKAFAAEFRKKSNEFHGTHDHNITIG